MVEKNDSLWRKKFLESPAPGEPFAVSKCRVFPLMVLLSQGDVIEVGVTDLRVLIPLKHGVDGLGKFCTA
jgi:hypothetical protein